MCAETVPNNTSVNKLTVSAQRVWYYLVFHLPQSEPCVVSACVNSWLSEKHPGGLQLSPSPECYWGQWRYPSDPHRRWNVKDKTISNHITQRARRSAFGNGGICCRRTAGDLEMQKWNEMIWNSNYFLTITLQWNTCNLGSTSSFFHLNEKSLRARKGDLCVIALIITLT